MTMLDDEHNPVFLGHAKNQWIPHRPQTWPARFGELKTDVEARIWNGHGADPEFDIQTWRAGTTVKIVMVSRFGDVGITTDLKAENGYHARIDLRTLDNLRMEPTKV